MLPAITRRRAIETYGEPCRSRISEDELCEEHSPKTKMRYLSRMTGHTEPRRAIILYVAGWVLAVLAFGAVVGGVWRLLDFPHPQIAGVLGVTLASGLGSAICSEPRARKGRKVRYRVAEEAIDRTIDFSYRLEQRSVGRLVRIVERVEKAEAENREKIEDLKRTVAQTQAKLDEVERDRNRTSRDVATLKASLSKAEQELASMRPQLKRQWAFRVLAGLAGISAFAAGLLALLPS